MVKPTETRGLALPKVAYYRLRMALTQSELAEAAGVSRPTIARAEKGEPVSLPNVRKIAKALHVSVLALQGEED